MTATLGRYRYWGDQKPDTSRPLLTFTRAADAVSAVARPGTPGEIAESATIRIYGPIDSYGGYWGVSSKEVAQALDLLGDAKRVVVRVNSPGGESAEGRAIMNLFRAHSAEIVTVVDGGAYSAASYIAMAGDERVMSPGSTMMIHDTSTYLYVNAAGARKAAEVLDTLSNSGAELYAEIAGGTVEEWREKQRAETWYSAASAVESGLMQRVGIVADVGPAETAGDEGPEAVDTTDVEERARAAYDLSLYEQAPAELVTPQPPTASAEGSTTTPEGATVVDFTTEQIATLRKQAGFPENADAGTITAALVEALNERADTPTASTTIPEGHVVIPAAKLADLEAGASAGTAAAAALRNQEREAFLDANRTKYVASNRAAWAKEYDRNPEGTREHFASAPDLVPTSALGHGVDGDDSGSQGHLASVTALTETETYKNWEM